MVRDGFIIDRTTSYLIDLPLGLFLEFVRAPASLLIGVWALLQVLFAYIGPAFGAVAWIAHVGGFLFGHDDIPPDPTPRGVPSAPGFAPTGGFAHY